MRQGQSRSTIDPGRAGLRSAALGRHNTMERAWAMS
jgi:hypothetical protein